MKDNVNKIVLLLKSGVSIRKMIEYIKMNYISTWSVWTRLTAVFSEQ